MSVMLNEEYIFSFSRDKSAASGVLSSIFFRIEEIVKENGGTALKTNDNKRLFVFGDKKLSINHSASACKSAVEIVKAVRGIGGFPEFNEDFRRVYHRIIGRKESVVSIGVSSGLLYVEYEKDERYPIKKIRGEAINRSKQIAEYFDGPYAAVVDASVISEFSEEYERSGSIHQSFDFVEISSIPSVGLRLRGPFFGLDHRLLPSRRKPEGDLLPPESAVPEQLGFGLNFGGDVDKPIAIIENSAFGVVDNEDQRQSYEDIKQKCFDISEDCGSRNQLSKLRSCALKLVNSMGDHLQDLKIRAFWSQMNSLRRQLEADERSRLSADPDYPPLPENIAASLGDLVDTLNVFSAHEPKLIELDELKRDPAERLASDASINAALKVTDGAFSDPQVVSQDAADSLKQVADDTNGDTPASSRAKEFLVKSTRNLALELIRRGYKLVKSEAGMVGKGVREGAYRMAGGLCGMYGAAHFVLAYEQQIRVLVNTLGGNPTLHKIIDLIVKFAA
ncbi:hypothetical protein [Azospirillum brasilense]|uniref:hypothetical protein n=1 Tax=Azospirillum brasilense TaxID=192 RepID=UPI001ED9FFC3|nr:hypothetical protein [Azospirillum brasilense]UKJ74509.1 hypothetical protein H1Q64_18290 [Azospirillum brasilense]